MNLNNPENNNLKNKSEFDSNQIMIHVRHDAESTIYLPVYLTVKVKNISEMQLGDLNAIINVALIIRIYFGDLPAILRE